MLNARIQNALNDQINAELSSSYIYLAMSAYCHHRHFSGSAAWLEAQSEEERAHAMKIYKFLIARGCPVSLKEIPAPETSYSSLRDVFAKALQQEIEVSAQIDALYELASEERAFAALVELQWFISEQVEEEKTARGIVAHLELIGDDPVALLDFDRGLGARGDPAR